MDPKKIMGFLVLAALVFGLLPVSIPAAYSDEPLPGYMIPTKDGKLSALPSDIPLYPGFKWSKPVLVKDKNSKMVMTFISSNRVKRADPSKIFDFYEKKLKKKGWEVQGPAGGSSSLGAVFKKGRTQVNFVCYSGIEVGTDVPNDPRGAKIEFTIPSENK
jgi:hypothetical protein